jgi:DNA-binding GntR family transcriptional regulator
MPRPAPIPEPTAPVVGALADRAYAELRDRLVTLRIAPGAAIDEDALMRDLGVGRTPIREAIKRLALEDLIAIFPRRGTFATDINITDLADISDVRMALEPHAAKRAAERCRGADVAEADALRRRLSAEHGADGATLMSWDAEVHRFIYRTARNPYLESTLTRYLNLSLRMWHRVLDRLPDRETSIHGHESLLSAIRDGDGEGARALAAEHVRVFEEELRRAL